ncbi:MAG: hypothetical protein WCO44_05855 [Bacteroidota bacterium]
MQTTNSTPLPDTTAASIINESVTKLDEQRLAGLQDFQQQQSFRNSILQQEKSRLEEKYGSDHPLVLKIIPRIAMQEQVNAGLNREISKASVKTVPFVTTSWRIQGKVYDSGNKPVQGYTVFLGDNTGIWNSFTATSCTDETGYYSLTVDLNMMKRLKKTVLFICVSDKNKKLVYLGQDAYQPVGGAIAYKDILLGDGLCAAPPVSERKIVLFGITILKWKIN